MKEMNLFIPPLSSFLLGNASLLLVSTKSSAVEFDRLPHFLATIWE